MSRAWWGMTVIPATREAEAGEPLATWEAEASVSQDHATAVQPGQQSETPSQNKQNLSPTYKGTQEKAGEVWSPRTTPQNKLSKHRLLRGQSSTD